MKIFIDDIEMETERLGRINDYIDMDNSSLGLNDKNDVLTETIKKCSHDFIENEEKLRRVSIKAANEE